jgi:hypothetical protein
MSHGLPPANGHPASAKRQPASPVIPSASTMKTVLAVSLTLGAFHRREAVWAERCRAGQP